MLEHSIGNPVGFRGWQKGAILSHSSQAGPAPEEPFFEARGLRYSPLEIHGMRMHDLVLKFSAILSKGKIPPPHIENEICDAVFEYTNRLVMLKAKSRSCRLVCRRFVMLLPTSSRLLSC